MFTYIQNNGVSASNSSKNIKSSNNYNADGSHYRWMKWLHQNVTDCTYTPKFHHFFFFLVWNKGNSEEEKTCETLVLSQFQQSTGKN